jgi:hypothetical protein
MKAMGRKRLEFRFAAFYPESPAFPADTARSARPRVFHARRVD